MPTYAIPGHPDTFSKEGAVEVKQPAADYFAPRVVKRRKEARKSGDEIVQSYENSKRWNPGRSKKGEKGKRGKVTAANRKERDRAVLRYYESVVGKPNLPKPAAEMVAEEYGLTPRNVKEIVRLGRQAAPSESLAFEVLKAHRLAAAEILETAGEYGLFEEADDAMFLAYDDHLLEGEREQLPPFPSAPKPTPDRPPIHPEPIRRATAPARQRDGAWCQIADANGKVVVSLLNPADCFGQYDEASPRCSECLAGIQEKCKDEAMQIE
jgi:hypothetical protein